MIEIVNAEKCTACNICVSACPTNVFDIVRGKPPKIARQEDCQTCFMCELYCPEDALYVAPGSSPDTPGHVQLANVQTQLGSYRHAIGWSKGTESRSGEDHTYELLHRAH